MSENDKDKVDAELTEETTEKLQSFLKRDIRYGEVFFPRPFFIEFFGSPGSGKTTTITEIDKFLRLHGFRVWRPQEGAEVIRHVERITPLYNIRTALYALTILIDQSHGHLYDVVIFDRCLYDAYCWMLYWQEKGLLTETETLIFQSFFTSRFWIDKIDIAYLMTCDAKEVMEREHRISMSNKQGQTTNPETIRKLISRCKRTYDILSPEHPELRIFDTTNMPEIEMVQTVTNDLLHTLLQKIK